ncbi:MAG TPA: hypothetical protein VFT64_10840 [Rickettsiales bacterium]|nr:hypothetical protein [Rickettsiales bacterium]
MDHKLSSPAPEQSLPELFTSRSTGILALLVGLLLGVSLYADFSVAFWGDQDWELLVSGMWLDGKKLYVDHVPVTPPLLFYLYGLPVLLSRHFLFLQDYQILVLLILVLVVSVIILCAHMMAQHPGFSTPSRKMQWVLLLCFLLMIRMRPPFVGDREHIFIITTLPYLLSWMPSLSPAHFSLRRRLLIGSLAAIGFFIKPQCMVLFVGIQIVHIFYTRSPRILRSPENIAIYVLGILYAAIVCLFTPEYLTVVLPIAYYTYSAIQDVHIEFISVFLNVFFTFAMFRFGSSSVYRKDIYYFLSLIPFLLLYVHINSGWRYTYQPFITVLLLVCGFVLWEFLDRNPGWTRTGWKPLLGVILCMMNFGLEAATESHYAEQVYSYPCRGTRECPGYYQSFLDVVREQHARSFGAMGMNFSAWTRVSKLSGASWVTRFPQFWMLPVFITAGRDFAEQHKGIFYYTAYAMAEDLEKNKPDIVFVELSQSLYTIPLGKTLNWVDVMNAIPAFTQAWQHYTLLKTIDKCTSLSPAIAATYPPPTGPGLKTVEYNCAFQVYKRIP